ncbi:MULTISPECIES: hypothetical protein [Bacillus]|uniref:hypothetical protein n=1 Tax=Bacillus TaxID=1386 RepID=UPI001CB8E4C5|nr:MULTISPECIES: hypothetical protein [Bacillus]MDR0125755.1 hypothetical protein [Bacillus zhangzhouensis]
MKIRDSVSNRKKENDADPITKRDWEPLEQYIRIKRAETRIADQGVATIVLTWDSAYWYHRDEQPSLDDINFSDGVIKSG